MKKNTRKTFYLMTFFAVAAMIAMGFLVMPNFNNSGTVSAQKAGINTQVATADMIAIATNTRSAGNFIVFADKAVSDIGNSQIKGNVGVAGKGAEVDLSRASVEGNTTVDPGEADRAKTDLASTFFGISQLPCTELADSELGGKSFSPGIYCVSSAHLAGQLVLDAKDNASGVFIFRVSGSFNAKAGSSIELINQTSPGNVYFVASDAINVGKGSSIKGNIFAENDVKVDEGSTITGRILSLNGGVSMSNDSVQLADGYVQICKAVNPNIAGNIAAIPVAGVSGDITINNGLDGNGNPINITAARSSLVNRVFEFTSPSINGGAPIEVQANNCSYPQLVPGAGNIVITESNRTRVIGNGTFQTGHFQLTDVREIRNNQVVQNSTVLTGYNFPLRTADVTVPMGAINQTAVIRFTNEFAIVGFIEVCKQGLDADVTGFFQFVVANVPLQGGPTGGVFSGAGSIPVEGLQVFTVMAGGGLGSCSLPIAVTVPSDGTAPRQGNVFVAELSRVGFFFDGASTDPADRLLGFGVINGPVIAGVVGARIFEAGASNNQTIINLFNRTTPATVKVCKVAGPGIAEGTPFTFTVDGFAPSFGEDGASIPGGVGVSSTFTVNAGAAPGGNCRIVPTEGGNLISQQRYVVGTNVTVTEGGAATTDNPIRVSRITSSSGFVSPAISGTTYFPSNGLRRNVTIPVRAGENVVQYTNFRFSQGGLKICKIAGAGITNGTNFNFNVNVDTNGGLSPVTNIPVTVAAGGCTRVPGPFTPTIGGFGSFNVGSLVTVSESATSNVSVTGIRTTSGGTFSNISLSGRTGGFTIVGATGGTPGITEVEFTNSQTLIAPPVTERATTAYDFDGDKKADISVFRDGNWYINRSELGFTAVPFGSKGDKLVSADYDGDHKADVAVYRVNPDGKGYFYILNSRSGIFLPTQFGLSTDVPVVGDYDGDGISDMAVYREGKNVGDESFIYYRPSGTPGADFTTIQLGVKGDIPVVGDYDGDGKTDAAVYRPSNGVWYMLQSRDGFKGVQFGISTDTPVAADYDGDGKTDLAVYRGGTWYMLQSTAGFTGVQFGIASDMPVPADVDGDGKDDIVVFRAGTWYWLNSGSNNSFQGMVFGIGSDVPVFCPANHQ